MTSQDLERHIADALSEVAPEADIARLDPDKAFRDQLDLDSIDFLRFVIALETGVGTKIPEVDYPKLSNLRGCASYLKALKNVPVS